MYFLLFFLLNQWGINNEYLGVERHQRGVKPPQTNRALVKCDSSIVHCPQVHFQLADPPLGVPTFLYYANFHQLH